MTKGRLLIAGGAHSDIPMIRAARSMGFEVITSGNRPADLGHAHADRYRPGDYSDPEAMLRIAREESVDALCAACNDFAALSLAQVAQVLGLPGHDTPEIAETIHHKDRYRAFALANGIPAPRAWAFDDLESGVAQRETLPYPVLVKPVDLTGGKGISRVDTPEALVVALQQAFAISHAGRVVVEEFLEGSRHGFSAFLRAGRVVFHFVDDEQYHLSPYLVSGASSPTSATDDQVRELVRQSEQIAALLKLQDGLFHVQFISHRGRPVIIEICRRPPGDLYVDLVRHATGVDYPSWIVRAAAGESIAGLTQPVSVRPMVRHCLMAERAGVLDRIVLPDPAPFELVDSLVWGRPGDTVTDPATHKFGILFLAFLSVDQLRAHLPRLPSLVEARMAID